MFSELKEKFFRIFGGMRLRAERSRPQQMPPNSVSEKEVAKRLSFWIFCVVTLLLNYPLGADWVLPILVVLVAWHLGFVPPELLALLVKGEIPNQRNPTNKDYYEKDEEVQAKNNSFRSLKNSENERNSCIDEKGRLRENALERDVLRYISRMIPSIKFERKVLFLSDGSKIFPDGVYQTKTQDFVLEIKTIRGQAGIMKHFLPFLNRYIDFYKRAKRLFSLFLVVIVDRSITESQRSEVERDFAAQYEGENVFLMWINVEDLTPSKKEKSNAI